MKSHLRLGEQTYTHLYTYTCICEEVEQPICSVRLSGAMTSARGSGSHAGRPMEALSAQTWRTQQDMIK